MKTNAQQINALAILAESKPFDAVQTAHFLAREIVGYNKSSDRLIDLQKQIDDTKTEKGTRKKAIDSLLKDLWTNNVKMVEGKGVTKCPIRIALKEVLSKEGLAEKSIANICGAVSYALKEKKPYDIKYLEKKAQQKKIDDAKKEGVKGATTPTAPAPATAPATAPAMAPATAPATPTVKVNAPKIESEKATQYMKAMTSLMENVFNLTEPRRMLNDEHEKTYDDIIAYMNEIMDLVSSLK
jgi:hypothetical protein